MTEGAGGPGRHRSPLDTLAALVASLGPCGWFPIAPATFASLVIAAGYAALPAYGGIVDGSAVVITTAVAIWAAGRAERMWGHDARRIVVDEAAGMAITLFLLPPGMAAAAAAFVAFRFFDILKPFPGRQAEGLPGGWGVVTDDVVAGIYANLAARGALALLPLLAR